MRACYVRDSVCTSIFFFFFNDTATTEIYTLSLHDALPISGTRSARMTFTNGLSSMPAVVHGTIASTRARVRDRKSTRLNSSHSQISYAVFCLKKKKKTQNTKLRNDSLTCRARLCVAHKLSY